jgi:hypothetical protein
MIALACDLDVTITDGTGLSSHERPQIRRVQAIEAISKLLHGAASSDRVPGLVRISGQEGDTHHSHRINSPAPSILAIRTMWKWHG